ncbi:D-alanyl-D-alanine carboxypeptidase, partial [Streptococcus sp. GMD4S]
MKKRYIVLSGLLAVTLAACSQEQPKNEENTQKTEQTSQPEGTVGSKSQASSQKKAEVVNKGDYYSIQGKYDEIVIANKHYPLSKDYNPGENPTAKAEL